jgi:general L-amino acid transport system permease protein
MADQAIRRGASVPRAARPPLWRDPRARAIFYQVVVIGGVLAVAIFLVLNTMENLATRSIRTGFGFLDQEAGFFIGESVIPWEPSDSYARAFVVGVLNTIQVAVQGIIVATILGTIVGIARLSSNWLIAKLASAYIETLRNIPLLLQLFFWYALIVGVLPPVRDALSLLPGVFLSSGGLQFAVPVYDPIHPYMAAAFLLGIVGSVFYYRWAHAHQAATGREPPLLVPCLGLILGLPFLVWLIGGAPTAMNVPEMQTFRFRGGVGVTPEFLALLLGLSLYTASFIAEIVRSGILAVPWGQTEAAGALGLRRGLVLRLVLLPQALRIIVPPTTSQYLNLTKNSSLAVAIGYPDLVSIANTSLNQTGQAIECISIMMAIYLTISLSISAFMNWYNKRIALVER